MQTVKELIFVSSFNIFYLCFNVITCFSLGLSNTYETLYYSDICWFWELSC